MNPPNLDPADIGPRLKSILDYVQDCERRVHRGEIMDLQGLDNSVIEICEAVARLPKDAAQAHESQMSQLIEHLDVLAAAMRAHATQIAVDGPFFALSNNIGNQVWGVEFFRLAEGERGPVGEDGLETDLFAGL